MFQGGGGDISNATYCTEIKYIRVKQCPLGFTIQGHLVQI